MFPSHESQENSVRIPMTGKVRSVAVRGFQSLWDTVLELGSLTVVIGPSNSGKSAFGRALRAIGRNQVSPGYVSKGASKATICLGMEDGSQVVLQRGKGTSAYAAIDALGAEKRYTKSGTSVPPDIEEILRMPLTAPDIHFGTQFDGPWLLGETGSVCSKVLGELTNVSLLAEAVREANRRRLTQAHVAQVRSQDAENDMQVLQANFSRLQERREAVMEARNLYEAVVADLELIGRLESLAGRLKTSQQAVVVSAAEVSRFESLLSSCGSLLDDAEELLKQADLLERLVSSLVKTQSKAKQQQALAVEAGQQMSRCSEKLQEVLKEVGRCPLCMQSTA